MKRFSLERYCGRPVLIAIYIIAMLTFWGCGKRSSIPREELQATSRNQLPSMRHTIQVGAFVKIDNAIRLTADLQSKGLNAYHFRHDSGLYKVRFGNYPLRKNAQTKAENLKAEGIIDDYYIVEPNDYAAANRFADDHYLRNEIVKSAKKYIGVPYRWGGESRRTGFDCSGLTMVVYRLNGLELPRSSRQQWQAGRPVKRSRLQKGDLVFFATSGGRRVSHVGIYAGDNNFLHAPGKGRKIRMSSLKSSYYKTRYLGARTYLAAG